MESVEKRRLLYIANARLPTEKAHGLQIVKSCESFSSLVAITLAYSTRKQPNPALENSSIQEYYHIAPTFPIVSITTPNLLWSFLSPQQQLPLFIVQSIIFAARAVRFAQHQSFDLLYTRDAYTALLLSFSSLPYAYEAHDLYETKLGNAWQKRCCKKARRIVTNTDYLRRQFIERFEIAPSRVLTARNGVDLAAIGTFQEDLDEVRRSLGIPQSAHVIVYTGHLFPWKGVHVLAQSMAALSERYHLVVVGGMQADVERFKEDILSQHLPNIHVVGHVPPNQLDQYRQLADVLVVPNTSDRYSTHLTCPIKVFEYMAAGRPIVASDLPAIREVLSDGENAILVSPDDPRSLAEGIRQAVEDRYRAKHLVSNALEEVRAYTWDRRAKNVLDFIFPNDRFEIGT